ncbi:unnamed protein product [Ambrosiozyma monospora]|uniref:Unnamed protein product n=1 Tax=Ambrosiozyma monospora TaxID=43982 RepID=A0A9W6Z4J0_AMBMO|nr:unnamed protein product [Ambrosiozyma monospora]
MFDSSNDPHLELHRWQLPQQNLLLQVDVVDSEVVVASRVVEPSDGPNAIMSLDAEPPKTEESGSEFESKEQSLQILNLPLRLNQI